MSRRLRLFAPLILASLTGCQDETSGRRLPVFMFDGGGPPDLGAPPDLGTHDAGVDGPDAFVGQRPDEIVVASYNVQNLFDLVDDPATDEGEFTPRAGQWDAARLATRIQRLVQVLSVLDADILLLNEIETEDVLTDLRDALRAAGGPDYVEVHVVPTRDPRGIGIGVLSRFPVRQAAGRPIGWEHRCQTPEGFTTLDGSRPEARPIFQVEIDFEGDDVTDLLLLGNHWKAKTNNSLPCADEEHRLRSALQLRDVFDTLLGQDPTLPVVALGDFNAFEFEPPLADALQAALDLDAVDAPTDLFNAWGDAGVILRDRNSNDWNDAQNSSYNFRGDWTRLDHILLSGNMRPGGEAAWQLVPGSMGALAPDFLLTAAGLPDSYDVDRGEGYSDHLPIRLRLRYAE